MKQTILQNIQKAHHKKFLCGLVLFLSMMFTSLESKASHAVGGQIYYTWISGNTYKLKLVVYRDCGGIALPTTATVTISPAAGSITSVVLNRTSVVDRSILCPGQVSTCNGGTVPGLEEHTFEGNVVFPTLANNGFYTINFSLNARSGAITTLTSSGSQNLFLSTTLNPNLVPQNSSPQFLNPPIGNFCAGQPATLSPNGFDVDGDAIVYSLINARQAATTSVTYAAGFSGTNPLTSSTGTTINPNTGVISFTPTVVGQVAIIAVKAEEYRNGVKIGEITRDIMVRIINCGANTAPVISNVSNVVVPVGQQFCLNVQATDANNNNITLTASSGITPAPSFVINSSVAGSASGTFCFTPDASHAGNTFTVSINALDNSCPSPASSVKTFNITVPAQCNVTAASNATASSCSIANGTATASLSGGTAPYSYSWTGPNGFTSFNQNLTGLAAGQYCVTIVDGNSCVATSCVDVTNTGSVINLTGSASNTTCGLNNGSVTVSPSGGTEPYAYSLNGGTPQSSSTFSNLAAGNYTIAVSGATGCPNTINITVGADADNIPPSIACTQNISVAAVNVSGAVVTYATPVGTDNCSVASTILTAGLASGSVFPIGTTLVTYRVTDASGNFTECSFNVTVNGSAPVVSNCPQTLYQQIYSAPNSCSQVFTYSPTISGIPTADVTYTFSGATTGSGTGTGSGASFNVGQTTVTVKATNSLGSSSCSFVVTVIDNIVPTAITKNKTVYLNAAGQASITPQDINNGSFDNCGPVTLAFNAGKICGFATENQSATLTAPAGTLITGIDFASYGTPNGSCGSFTIGSCHASNSIAKVTPYLVGNNSGTVPATNTLFGDPCYGTGKRLYIQASYGGGNPNVATFNCSQLGNNNVTLLVTDANGNVSSATATVTVLDTIAPTISGPSDISAIATSAAGAVVGYSTPVGVDNCSSTTVRTAGFASGATFPIGTTTVTHTVTDASGLSAQHSFNVTVVGVAPSIVCPSNITVDATNGLCGAAVNFTANESIGIPASTITYSIAPGTVFSVGTTQVTATATNAVGSSSCTFTVTVVDNQFPVLVGVPADVTVECNAVPAAASVTATDNCSTSVPTYTETRTNGDCPSRYTLTRTWSTTDASNNTTTASQVITVQDTQAPVLSAAPANITVECNAVPTAAVLTATDNCDAPTVTYAEVRANGNCPSNYTLTRTWTATDACGNTSSKTQVITVQDTQAPVLSAAPADVTVECNAVPTAAVLTATDNCDNAPTVAYVQTSTQNADINNAGHYNYTLTRIWTATDACGNTSSKTQVITVQDKTAPAITCPAIAPVCNDLAGNIKTLTLTGVDNCNSPILVSYTVSGATVKAATTSATATESFNVGTSYVNWTVKDVSGNTITCTTTVVIWALPVASYVTSNADAFCNKLAITANSTLSGPYTYAWSYNNAPFATTQQIQLDNTNGDGNYSVYTYDVNGCRSAVPAVYNYQKQNIISNYTILANKEVELHGYNSVQSGSVGLMKAEGKAEFEKYASMTGAGAFVKAPKIEVDNGASVPTKIIGIATVSLPTMQVNTITNQQYNALPSYTVNQSQTISLSGNYKDLKIKKGANVTLSGTVFGKIDIEEGSVVRFTSTTINIGDMKVGKGPNNGSTIVKFANNTSVRVSKQVKIEEDCNINPDGYQVTFYLGDEKCDEEKFQVKGGNTTVTANIYAPNGKIKVTGGSNCHNHGNGGYVNMIGLFIADEVESEGKYVNWNNYTCTNTGNAAPVANYASIDAAEEVVSKLEVRVAPNPTSSEFVLMVNSKSTDLVNIKVTDAYGKVVAMINKVVPGSAIRVGNNFTSGVYFAEVIQGSKRSVVKMVKGI